jgi:hypothetical protein
MANNKKDLPWAGSDAKKILQQALRDGEIPISSVEMAPRDVYALWPEFQLFLYKRFQARVHDERNLIIKDNN